MVNFAELTVPVSGAVFPRLGFGTWKCDELDATIEVVYQALKSGYRHIDCASVYGNEENVGAGIRKAIDEGIVARDQIWVTSKLWCSFHKQEHVEMAVRKSLSDLGLDYLDLYLVHFPLSLKFVPIEERYPSGWVTKGDSTIWEKVPLSETWKAMENLVDKKLVKHIGLSNFDLQLLQDLLTYCRIRPIVNQIELHPYLQQNNLVRFCSNEKIAITAYSPFGSLSYIPMDMVDENEPKVLEEPVLKSIAKAHKKTTAQVIIRWILQLSPWLTTIPKSSCVARAKQNYDIFDFSLSEQEMKDIAKLNRNKRYNDSAIFTVKLCKKFVPIFD